MIKYLNLFKKLSFFSKKAIVLEIVCDPEGHPAEVMDMSFGLQSLMSEYIVKNKDSLKPGMIEVPVDIDDRVGFLKLQSMGVEIDKLTDEQYNYIHGYEERT